MKGTKSWKRRLLWLALAMTVFGLLFLKETGWLNAPKDWREVSGWDNLTSPPNGKSPGEPRLTWLGHSGFLLEWHGIRLVTDPNLSRRCGPVKRLTEPADPNSLGSVHVALISHAHYDHFDIPSLTKLPGLKRVIAPSGLDDFLPVLFRSRVHFHGMKEGERLDLGPLTIIAVHAAHRGGRNHPLHSKYSALGYIISDGERTLYFAGDTAFGPHFEEIAKNYKPDLAILPIGAYAPRFVLKHHHLNPEDAVLAAKTLGVKTVVPCHFGTFRLAFDNPDQALPRFAAAAKNAGLDWYLPTPQNTEPDISLSP